MNPPPGKEAHTRSKDGWYDYRYCHTNGQRFQRNSRSLKACREAKNSWIKKLEAK